MIAKVYLFFNFIARKVIEFGNYRLDYMQFESKWCFIL